MARNDVDEAMDRVLGMAPATPEGFTARVAREDDCPFILRLIQDLALYERDPDAVVVTEEELRRDGFSGNRVFYCFLIESTEDPAEEGADPYERFAGFALFFIAYSTWSGRFIYLEDLFVKETFRKRNLGSFLISKLVLLASELGMPRLQWAALDWNTPALNFYQKIGAQQLNDWILHRMEGPALEAYRAQISQVEGEGGATAADSSQAAGEAKA